MKSDSSQKNEEFYQLINKIDSIVSSFRDLELKIDRIESHLENRNSTIEQFYKKRIQIAIDELYDYVRCNMPTALFVGGARLLLKEKALQRVALEGAFLEFGVYKGQSLAHMANLVSPKMVYGFDSFDGLPEDWGVGHAGSSGKKNVEFFGKDAFRAEIPSFEDNVSLYIGIFEETIDRWMFDHPDLVAYLHIDCDLYSSAKTVLMKLSERITQGTVIVFDEYFGYFEWRQGEYKAFQEFVKENNIEYEYLYYRHDQVAVVVK